MYSQSEITGNRRKRYVNHLPTGRRCGRLQVNHSCGLKLLPLIGQAGRELAHARCRQVDQQLCQIVSRVDVMAPTGAGKTDQDGRRASAGRIAHEQGSFRLSTTERERNSDESLYDYCGVQRAASPSREAWTLICTRHQCIGSPSKTTTFRIPHIVESSTQQFARESTDDP